jgi:hypothetical protein
MGKAAIVKERLALEDAIRKIESGGAQLAKGRDPAQSAISSGGMPDGGAASDPPRHDDATPASADMPEGGWPAVLLDAREQLLSGRSSLEKQSGR